MSGLEAGGTADAALVERAGTPLCPQPEVDQGDPYLVAAPPGSRHRYYVYVTGAGFPAYCSDDLLTWTPLGPSRPAAGDAWCWAPCVRYVPGLRRPWVMLYSRAQGGGPVDGHRGHRLRRADSERPEGPFVDSGEVLTPDADFSIDPDVYRAPDGSWRLAFATDFVADPPLGTGLVDAGITADLRRLTTPVRTVARAGAEWQLYDPHRALPWKPIPGVRWETGETVRWYCIEGPVGLTSPGGRQLMLYSGGNFAAYYGIGVLLRDPAGGWGDLSRRPEDCLLRPRPDRGLYGPGHCSVAPGPHGPLMCFHFRTAPGGPRQFGIVPLRWNAADLPYCPL